MFKALLTSTPILALPDISSEDLGFTLDIDASDLAIGAVLSQESPDDELVIAFAVRALDPTERKYSTTRK